jgi:hypothetical protein
MKAVNADTDTDTDADADADADADTGVVWCGVGDVTSNKAMAGGIYWSVCREGIVALIDLCTAACQAI